MGFSVAGSIAGPIFTLACGILPDQGLNPCLLALRQILSHWLPGSNVLKFTKEIYLSPPVEHRVVHVQTGVRTCCIFLISSPVGFSQSNLIVTFPSFYFQAPLLGLCMWSKSRPLAQSEGQAHLRLLFISLLPAPLTLPSASVLLAYRSLPQILSSLALPQLPSRVCVFF